MSYKVSLAALAITLLAACERSAPPPVDLAAEAQRITRESIIVDTHIDVPYRLTGSPDNVSEATEGGDFDYPRARAGGLDAAFMSIYTSAELEAEGKSRDAADQLIEIVENIVASSNGKFAIATSPAEVRKHFEAGVISLPMGMENGSPLEGDLAALQYFYERGIRYITLAHSLSNHISDSSFDDNRLWNGLSEFGVDVVREMNRLGIMVDISHLSDEAFWQVLEVSATPVIASHSSARHFTPGWERNMSDEMITALAEKGGVIMINFGSAFITEEARQYSSERWPASTAFVEEHGDLPREEALKAFAAQWEAEHGPMPYASLDDVLDHFDHVIKLVGVDHVGIGSDYDGVGDSLPTGLKDVSAYPNLAEGLLRRGYSEADIRKILGENLLRVWQAIDDYAATTSIST
ncbi:MAG: peptidase M19 [Thiotrichales bacterium SG8_50]|nr:MAG: peptidase M19 [Thiotrichales bacterium SG8_50]